MNKEEATDPHLSFREKWTRHLERRKHKLHPPSPMASPRSRLFQNSYGKNINRYVPLILLMFFLATGFYGVCFAMPALYENSTTLKLMQVLSCLSFIQLLSHWFITRNTDSVYKPEIYGTEDSNAKLHLFSNHRLDSKDIAIKRLLESEYIAGKKENSNSNNNVLSNITTDKDSSSIYSLYNNSIEPNIGDSSILTSQMKDSTILQVKDSTPLPLQKQLAFYWSWTTCSACQRSRPPRCHHCPICEKCILKRDHHCFFTGVCIGVNNQRHFIAFMFWAMFTTVFGILHMFPYIYYVLLGHISFFDFFPFFAFYRGLLGYIELSICLLCILFWGLCAFTLISIFFFYQIAQMTLKGITNFEKVHKVKVTDTRTVTQRLRHIMGENWILNFVVPYKRNTRMREDAIFWPYIKR